MSHQYERPEAQDGNLRLHLNENTAGCSPNVARVLRELTRQDAALYPDYDAVVARTAARIGVSDAQIVLTNGLDEGILALTIAALRDRGAEAPEAIVVVPAFDMYASTADGVGARVVEVPLGPDFAFQPDAVIAAVTPRTRLLFLTSPNNPSGNSLAAAEIARVARAAPHVRVLVDEAYIDFGGETLVGNPAVKDDWWKNPKTSEEVTFIDFARSEGRFSKHFDKDGNPSEVLLHAKQDRLENWRLLQELAGIR